MANTYVYTHPRRASAFFVVSCYVTSRGCQRTVGTAAPSVSFFFPLFLFFLLFIYFRENPRPALKNLHRGRRGAAALRASEQGDKSESDQGITSWLAWKIVRKCSSGNIDEFDCLALESLFFFPSFSRSFFFVLLFVFFFFFYLPAVIAQFV